jgi:hypothetical protein
VSGVGGAMYVVQYSYSINVEMVFIPVPGTVYRASAF